MTKELAVLGISLLFAFSHGFLKGDVPVGTLASVGNFVLAICVLLGRAICILFPFIVICQYFLFGKPLWF